MKSFKTQIKEDIQPGYAPTEVEFMGYKSKNLHYAPDAAKAFQETIQRFNDGKLDSKSGPKILDALKHTDQYMNINDSHIEQGKQPDEKELALWRHAHMMARNDLHDIGEFMHHMDYWHDHEHELQDIMGGYNVETAGADMVESVEPILELTDKTIKPSDKVKVARVIADMLGVEKAESMSPEIAINTGLRSIKSKRITPELVSVLRNMLNLAKQVGVDYDSSLIKQIFKEEKSMSFRDYVKAKVSKINNGVVPGPEVVPGKTEHGAEPEVGATPTGTTMHPIDGEQDHVRKMKVKYKLGEDIDSADFKTSPSGRKYRARKIVFKSDEDDIKESKVKSLKDFLKLGEGHQKKVNKKKKNFQATMKGRDIIGDTSKELSWQGNRDQALKAGRAAIKEEEDKDESGVLDNISDKDIDSMANSVTHEDHVMDAYEDDEFTFIDPETGEEVESDEDETVNESLMMEVMSRIERMKAKSRFRQTKAKRERRLMIVLKRRSDTKTINKRARRLAINMLKQRLMKKPVAQMSISEKERVERMLQTRKNLVDRLAMKLAPRVRKIEAERLSHSKVTKDQ